jgi:hypothetical protein
LTAIDPVAQCRPSTIDALAVDQRVDEDLHDDDTSELGEDLDGDELGDS